MLVLVGLSLLLFFFFFLNSLLMVNCASGKAHYRNRQVIRCTAGLAACQEEGNHARETQLRSPLLGHQSPGSSRTSGVLQPSPTAL